MYVLSRKTRLSIERRLVEMADGTFTELAIKDLMVDLRELARGFLKVGNQPKFDTWVRDFLDVCDFLAHSPRDRGVIETNVRARAEALANAMSCGDEEEWARLMSAGPRAIHGDQLAAGLLGTAHLFLEAFDSPADRSDVLRAFERRSEVALCIISILQDAAIELKPGCGRAMLHMVSHEGRYHLYCRVFRSRLEQEARARTGSANPLVFGFPVVSTEAEDIDHVLPQLTGKWTAWDPRQQVPLVETYRAADGSLHIRAVDDAES